MGARVKNLLLIQFLAPFVSLLSDGIKRLPRKALR